MKKWTKEEILTIPNALSLFRIVLAVLIPIVFYQSSFAGQQPLLAAIVIVSGLTDFLDGKIARHFDMISDFGKMLDPFADKLTQLALLICLIGRARGAIVLLVLLVVKEVIQATGAFLVLRKTKVYDGAKWYGKVNTALFYLIALILLFVKHLPPLLVNVLLAVCGVSMAVAFILYLRQYHNELKKD